MSSDTIPFERETILSAQNNADSYWCCKNSEQICIEKEQENVAHIFSDIISEDPRNFELETLNPNFYLMTKMEKSSIKSKITHLFNVKLDFFP